MDIKELYKLWCDSAVDDSDLQRELEDIKNDDEAINDRFYSCLLYTSDAADE